MKEDKYGLFTSILVALGPILWLFINLYDKNYERIWWNIFAVIVTSALVLWKLRNYLKIYNKRGSILLDILSHILSFGAYILLLAAVVIVFIGFFILINLIQEKLFIKGDYIIHLIKSPYGKLMFVIMMIVANSVGIIIIKKKDKLISMEKWFKLYCKVDKVLIISIIPLLYIILTSFTVITEDGIYDYSFYNLKGNKYSFSDVDHVSTGFENTGKDKGTFFYNIELKNGTKLKLSDPSMAQPSGEYDDDSWQEYVDIDKYIMNSGAKKDSSEEGSEFVSMDKVYVDKLLRVVRNK